jgi:hypothetical protein
MFLINNNRVHFGIIQFSNKHTEIFGTFIEILKKYNLLFTIYYNLDKDDYTFLKYYEKIFGKLEIKKCNEINYSHDFFIITSSSDEKNYTDIINRISHKSIYVHHQKAHHKSFMNKTITVSPVINTTGFKINEYILPIYKIYKKVHWKKTDKTVFGIIGGIRGLKNGNTFDKDLNLIKKFIEKYPNDNYEFWIFMRKWDWIGITRYHSFLLKNPKIIAFPGLSTEKLINKLHKVKFILPLSKKDGWFYNQRLTGSIPFAINFNIPLIIETNLAKLYSLEDCSFCYNDSLDEFANILNIDNTDYYNKIIELVKYKRKITKQNELNFINLCMKITF